MGNRTEFAAKPHDEAEELLPWYATGQLERDDQARVEQHLSNCALCRRQLAFERRMVAEFQQLAPEVDSGWIRLKQRLADPASHISRPKWQQDFASKAAAFWQVVRTPRVAGLAIAQLVFTILAASVLLSLSRPSYRALASASPPQSANVIAIFRSDTTELEMRSLLQHNRASLVGGPTSTNAYLLRVPAQSRPSVIANIRSDRHVVMAEPIDGGTS